MKARRVLAGRLAGCSLIAAVVLWTDAARAQGDRNIPSLGYHAAFLDYYDGEYKDALKDFQYEGRGAIKTPQSRWIDSICYETMVGECYYQMGHLSRALEHYTAAVKLYVAFSDWMIRVKFPTTIRQASTRVRIPWGASLRRARLGHYPTSMLIGQGRIDHKDVIERGGVVQQAILCPIQVQEIVRCTTLAIRRRASLLGPIGRHDPLTAELIAALQRRPGPPNHWSEAWINVQLGVALLAGGKENQALPYLTRSVSAAGEFDHPLTSPALLELGRLALRRGDYTAATKFFEETTYAAVNYPDAGILEEAFRYAALTHLAANRKGIYRPLAVAAQWAKVKDLRQLRASLLLSAAENCAVVGQTKQAAGLLGDAQATIGRRDMSAGRIGARWNYLNSLVSFQQKRIVEGDAALAAAMKYMRHGSHWLFRISLADGLYTGGAISPRVAMDLYTNVLRDPQPDDWAFEAMESFAVLVTPHEAPIEHWFEVSLKRKAHERALEIADCARRHRFFCSLAFGGRLLSLRWILEGPTEELDKQSQLLRQDLLTRYPTYDRLSKQAGALRGRLDAMPLAPADGDALRAQGKELAALAALSVQREAILREMAVRREPASLVFPPLRSTGEIQKSLPDGQAMLALFATRSSLYGFLLNKKKYNYWRIDSPDALARQITKLLREMGHFQSNHELSLKNLSETKWKQSAQVVLDMILKGSKADFSQQFDELVIVPDGVTWYVPFEALQVETDGKLLPLISRFRIRYVPTASLAVATGRGRSPTGSTAVVVGRLYPRDNESVARAAFDRLAEVVPKAVALQSPLPGPSAVYGALFDRLLVLDDIHPSDGGPYAWAPVPSERNKAGGSLGEWLALPWGGPDEIILPGYHTAAESSLKNLGPMPGGEMFLSACGLMATGVRTILLSRWRTGGRSSFDLVGEFVQELPHATAAEAWQRAVFLTAGSQLDIDAEPRIKRNTTDEAPKTDHPFFWAGYMLIDSGTPPQMPEPKDDEPALELKK